MIKVVSISKIGLYITTKLLYKNVMLCESLKLLIFNYK